MVRVGVQLWIVWYMGVHCADSSGISKWRGTEYTYRATLYAAVP